jgi:hypothetical protein
LTDTSARKPVVVGLCGGVDSRTIVPEKWSSLDDAAAVGAELFGARGHERVVSWLEVEAARTNDRDLALQFSDHLADLHHGRRLFASARRQTRFGVARLAAIRPRRRATAVPPRGVRPTAPMSGIIGDGIQ